MVVIRLTLPYFPFFPSQLNVERSTQRRPPQQITSIAQPFDAASFNFNKVNDCEILIKCNYRLHGRSDTDALVTFLINNSPLTRYHSLICPRLSDNLSQILTEQSIRFAVDVLRGFDDNCYRIGFNSLGAFASVNHLHMHLMHIEMDLFIENVVRILYAPPSYAKASHMHVQYY